MADTGRIGEVIEACTTDFVAQCYELYELPSFGCLVNTGSPGTEVYAVVYNASTAGIEPGRRPIARGKDETDEAGIYRSNPQLTRLLRSEFRSLVVGYRQNGNIYHYLPPRPAHIHSFVNICTPEEVKLFSQSLGFLNILLKTRLLVSVEELVSACLREMSQAYQADRRTFLIAAGKELALSLGSEYDILRAILRGLNDAAR